MGDILLKLDVVKNVMVVNDNFNILKMGLKEPDQFLDILLEKRQTHI
ncbi:hypothetical protein ccbrp13_56900 [Ktedonobacteria bacterium brp13]|nr:hypothetical protein ccbrp13_56900 [Ktedonobacteria bacterium brp13]